MAASYPHRMAHLEHALGALGSRKGGGGHVGLASDKHTIVAHGRRVCDNGNVAVNLHAEIAAWRGEKRRDDEYIE